MRTLVERRYSLYFDHALLCSSLALAPFAKRKYFFAVGFSAVGTPEANISSLCSVSIQVNSKLPVLASFFETTTHNVVNIGDMIAPY